jgi:hypothetical protein
MAPGLPSVLHLPSRKLNTLVPRRVLLLRLRDLYYLGLQHYLYCRRDKIDHEKAKGDFAIRV